jgi:hypothetical protein
VIPPIAPFLSVQERTAFSGGRPRGSAGTIKLLVRWDLFMRFMERPPRSHGAGIGALPESVQCGTVGMAR